MTVKKNAMNSRIFIVFCAFVIVIAEDDRNKRDLLSNTRYTLTKAAENYESSVENYYKSYAERNSQVFQTLFPNLLAASIPASLITNNQQQNTQQTSYTYKTNAGSSSSYASNGNSASSSASGSSSRNGVSSFYPEYVPYGYNAFVYPGLGGNANNGAAVQVQGNSGQRTEASTAGNVNTAQRFANGFQDYSSATADLVNYINSAVATAQTASADVANSPNIYENADIAASVENYLNTAIHNYANSLGVNANYAAGFQNYYASLSAAIQSYINNLSANYAQGVQSYADFSAGIQNYLNSLSGNFAAGLQQSLSSSADLAAYINNVQEKVQQAESGSKIQTFELPQRESFVVINGNPAEVSPTLPGAVVGSLAQDNRPEAVVSSNAAAAINSNGFSTTSVNNAALPVTGVNVASIDNPAKPVAGVNVASGNSAARPMADANVAVVPTQNRVQAEVAPFVSTILGHKRPVKPTAAVNNPSKSPDAPFVSTILAGHKTLAKNVETFTPELKPQNTPVISSAQVEVPAKSTPETTNFVGTNTRNSATEIANASVENVKIFTENADTLEKSLFLLAVPNSNNLETGYKLLQVAIPIDVLKKLLAETDEETRRKMMVSIEDKITTAVGNAQNTFTGDKPAETGANLAVANLIEDAFVGKHEITAVNANGQAGIVALNADATGNSATYTAINTQNSGNSGVSSTGINAEAIANAGGSSPGVNTEVGVNTGASLPGVNAEASANPAVTLPGTNAEANPGANLPGVNAEASATPGATLPGVYVEASANTGASLTGTSANSGANKVTVEENATAGVNTVTTAENAISGVDTTVEANTSHSKDEQNVLTSVTATLGEANVSTSDKTTATATLNEENVSATASLEATEHLERFGDEYFVEFLPGVFYSASQSGEEIAISDRFANENNAISLDKLINQALRVTQSESVNGASAFVVNGGGKQANRVVIKYPKSNVQGYKTNGVKYYAKSAQETHENRYYMYKTQQYGPYQ